MGESEGDALRHATAPVVHAASGARRLRRALWLVPGLLVFVLALELLKRGAAGLAPLLRALDVDGLAGGLGFGWLAACVVLSGSPVAATSSSRTVSQAAWASLPSSSRWCRKYGLSILGMVNTHCACPTSPSTSSRSSAAVAAPRLAAHDGHSSRVLHENARRYSAWHSGQMRG